MQEEWGGIVAHTFVVTLVSVMLAGLLAGWLSGLVTRGRGFGLPGNILLAWPGAAAGLYLGRWLGLGSATAFSGTLLASLLGAFALLYVVAGFRR
jgi:uncharacterized membrane protein YeaQ/YmgE (transglycosylase-associated protein family)